MDTTPRPKLKPLHWDKVRASPDRAMVWDQLKSGSFELNEEMIETLFVYNTPNTAKTETTKRSVLPPAGQNQRILEPKKSQNVAILLRALNVTREEICDALMQGDGLSTELLEKLVACTELRGRRLFLKLLEAVLKTGNRMNAGTFRGDAQAFNLDTLLKLADVKGTDGKTTLLHFVVQEIIRSEGMRIARTADQYPRNSYSTSNSRHGKQESSVDNENDYQRLGLQVVAGLSNELHNVKKAIGIDSDVLTNSTLEVHNGLYNLKEIFHTNGPCYGKSEADFCKLIKSIVEKVEQLLLLAFVGITPLSKEVSSLHDRGATFRFLLHSIVEVLVPNFSCQRMLNVKGRVGLLLENCVDNMKVDATPETEKEFIM